MKSLRPSDLREKPRRCFNFALSHGSNMLADVTTKMLGDAERGQVHSTETLLWIKA